MFCVVSPHTLPLFSRRDEKHNKFTLEFRTESSSSTGGLLLWTNLGGATLRGDYLAVALVGGRPEMRFNLGKRTGEAVRIRAKVKCVMLDN